MSEQAIVEKIISDAEENAAAIIADAENKATATIAEAEGRAAKRREDEARAVAERRKIILDGKAATARLDSAKILLGEKRGVIDEVYARALKALKEAGKSETLSLAERLLKAFAEEGDEVVLAKGMRYAEDIAKLPVIKEKKLKISAKTADIEGGFILLGKTSDKNLSYSALLTADREEHQAEIAAILFAAENK